MIGIIYKLKCLETNEFYIGSTFNMNKRIHGHTNLNQNKMVSTHIIKRNNYKFIILEEREVNSKLSLELIENLYILIGWKTSKCINSKMSYNSDSYRKWYYSVKHRERHNETNREWKKNNLEKARQSARKYQQKNYQKNKDRFNEKAREKVKCNYCNAIVNRKSLKRHQSRNICLNNRLNL